MAHRVQILTAAFVSMPEGCLLCIRSRKFMLPWKHHYRLPGKVYLRNWHGQLRPFSEKLSVFISPDGRACPDYGCSGVALMMLDGAYPHNGRLFAGDFSVARHGLRYRLWPRFRRSCHKGFATCAVLMVNCGFSIWRHWKNVTFCWFILKKFTKSNVICIFVMQSDESSLK